MINLESKCPDCINPKSISTDCKVIESIYPERGILDYFVAYIAEQSSFPFLEIIQNYTVRQYMQRYISDLYGPEIQVTKYSEII